MDKLASNIKNVLAVIGLSVVTVVFVELVCRAAVFAYLGVFGEPHSSAAPINSDERADLAAYDGVDYDARRLMQEVRASDPVDYEPYNIWLRRYFKGEYTNVDFEGRRATHFSSQSEDALEVWMFGGSTTWGVGAKDDETVPSLVAKLLNEDWGVETKVVNYGERGYVSTQELVYLIRELQAGKRPDVVTFYDGVNDATAVAFWPEERGAHALLDDIRERFQGGRSRSDQVRALVQSTGMYRAADLAGRILHGPPDPGTAEPGVGDENYEDRLEHADFDWLGNRALDVWAENIRLVNALAAEYGFTPIFIFHPGLWEAGKPLHPSEQHVLEVQKRSVALTMIMTVRAKMAELLEIRMAGSDVLASVHNLDGAFSSTTEPVYIDYTHISGNGNRIVAGPLRGIIVETVCRERPASLSETARAGLNAKCPVGPR
ncbi:MAG: SGNH/GDSL hydrolase family protein [SAR202 cluster bacterium]|nr:SGNH/GDSL hydrolase family protein [SAR202 cluster bacterium]